MELSKSVEDIGLEGQARGRGSEFIAEGYERIMSNADRCCFYSYLMMSSKTLRTREQDTFRTYRGSLESSGKHADPNAGEMVLPMMMTRDNHFPDQKAVELATRCKAFWRGYLH